ncbi:hypothetical protein C882_4525 [Caenispirillum salinarum AK4]|uniref:DUF4169 family protein n=1 Tax=Caenispirillum salinarum AK4 TaxID=1238182 RepID=K9HQ58_9PROT|nr:DUF4169 family protein [Caenispirillum salinarum]EKV30566.1 hypothetical protein C882_4525 [Caenispirillum salinarum AK4]
MAEIINLRHARKQRARAEKEQQAADNRRKHGRTKAERRATDAERARADRDLSGKRLADRAGPGAAVPRSEDDQRSEGGQRTNDDQRDDRGPAGA